MYSDGSYVIVLSKHRIRYSPLHVKITPQFEIQLKNIIKETKRI